VVVPLLFALVFGVVEMGRLVMVGQLAESAAAKGSREASKIATSSASSVQNWVTNYLQNAGVPPSAVTVNVTPAGDLSSLNAGDQVAVTVQVNFADVTWIPPVFLSSGTQLTASSVMARE